MVQAGLGQDSQCPLYRNLGLRLPWPLLQDWARGFAVEGAAMQQHRRCMHVRLIKG